MLWLRQVLALAWKELLTILKDPKSRVVVIGPPIVQFFVFGYAATFDVADVAYVVVDQDRSPESRDVLARLASSPSFRPVGVLASPAQIAEWIDPMRARLAVQIGPDFAADLHAGRPAELQVILDGRNSNVSGIALAYLQSIVTRWAIERQRGNAAPAVEVVSRAWFNPTLDSRTSIVSGLPAQLALVVVMLLTSLSVAREREHGTFDQTLVAPVDALQILIAKALPAFGFGIADGLLLSAGAVLWFEVPMTGTVPALAAVLAVYALGIVGVGLFISSLAQTMQQGLLGAFMFIMPAVILSGFTTPIENMPSWLQTATVANPARYAVAGCRAVFLEGAHVGDVARYLLPMLGVAAVTLPAAGWLFRHRAG